MVSSKWCLVSTVWKMSLQQRRQIYFHIADRIQIRMIETLDTARSPNVWIHWKMIIDFWGMWCQSYCEIKYFFFLGKLFRKKPQAHTVFLVDWVFVSGISIVICLICVSSPLPRSHCTEGHPGSSRFGCNPQSGNMTWEHKEKNKCQ